MRTGSREHLEMLDRQEEELANWIFVEKTANYHYWRCSDSDGKPYYNCTKDDNPPVEHWGYYNLQSLKAMKNDK